MRIFEAKNSEVSGMGIGDFHGKKSKIIPTERSQKYRILVGGPGKAWRLFFFIKSEIF